LELFSLEEKAAQLPGGLFVCAENKKIAPDEVRKGTRGANLRI